MERDEVIAITRQEATFLLGVLEETEAELTDTLNLDLLLALRLGAELLTERLFGWLPDQDDG